MAAFVAAGALLLGVVAMVVPTSTVGAAPQASVSVSKTSVSKAGETVTVSGTGFDLAANVGTRPPFAGQPSGVYVVFGTFDQPWAPSAGAPGSARRVIEQVWALPAAQRAVLDPAGTNPDFATINPDGTFIVDLEVALDAGGTGDYGIVTYAGSGADNADQETFTPISFSDPSTVPAAVSVSKTDVPKAGETVTVSGTGFDLAANVGMRPPFAGQPSGVYVVFGTFDQPWAPSEGAGSGARRMIEQVWALPAAQRAMLDPAGTNPDFATLNPDGTFSVDLEVAPRPDATGTYAIATYPGSGAINAGQETFTRVSFFDPSASTTSTTSTTTKSRTPSSSTAPSTTRKPLPPSVVREQRLATGVSGQKLTVDPATGLKPAGDKVLVSGSGYDPKLGIYVTLCVDNGPGVLPEPCVGGGGPEAASSVWISSNPPSYGAGMVEPFGPGGTFEVELDVAAADEFVDCEKVRCAVVTKADHTASANRSADVRVPVSWAGQDPTTTERPVATTAPKVTTPSAGPGRGAAPPTTSDPLVREARSATGASGQKLTVDPATGLNPDGDTVTVTGSGYDPKLGIYVALCVDQGPGVVPAPCLGGGGPETDADGGASVWISSNPPSYGADLVVPFSAGGTFEVELDVAATDEFVDCEKVRCAVVTKADHMAGADRSADARVPVSWAGQDPADSAQALSKAPAAVVPQTVVTTLTATPNTAATAPRVAGATQLPAATTGSSLAKTGVSAGVLLLAGAVLILAGLAGRTLARRVENS